MKKLKLFSVDSKQNGDGFSQNFYGKGQQIAGTAIMSSINPFPYPMSSREPYPFPRLENDTKFRRLGCRQVDKLKLRPLPTHLAQKEDPWNRVNRTHTLSSARHEVCYTDPKAPRDFLDFALTAVYRPHFDWDQPRADVVMQKETLNMDHGRILKNRIVFVPARQPVLGHPLRINFWHMREHPSYVKKAIRGVHSQLTNPGYSRKAEDGNVYFK